MWPPLPQVPSEAGVRHPSGRTDSQSPGRAGAPFLPRPAIPRRPGQRVPGLRDCPSPWGWRGPQLCGSVWFHFAWMLLLQELRTETRGTPTPQQVAPSLCHLPENEGITELSRTVPNPGPAQVCAPGHLGQCPACEVSAGGVRTVSLGDQTPAPCMGPAQLQKDQVVSSQPQWEDRPWSPDKPKPRQRFLFLSLKTHKMPLSLPSSLVTA